MLYMITLEPDGCSSSMLADIDSDCFRIWQNWCIWRTTIELEQKKEDVEWKKQTQQTIPITQRPKSSAKGFIAPVWYTCTRFAWQCSHVDEHHVDYMLRGLSSLCGVDVNVKGKVPMLEEDFTTGSMVELATKGVSIGFVLYEALQLSNDVQKTS